MNQRHIVEVSTALAFGPLGIIWAFLPVYLRSLGSSYLLISLLSLLPAVEMVVLSPFWGGILDRSGRGDRILLVSFMAEAVSFSIFPMLTSSVEFAIVVSLVGLFSSSFIPVYAAMATLASSQYGRAIGRFWVSASLGYASVTILGGVLYQYFSVNFLFVLGAAYGFLGCLILILSPRNTFVLNRSREPTHGYWGLLRQRRIAVLCILSIAVLISASAFNNFFTVYLVDVLNGSRIIAGLAAAGTTML